MRGHVHALRTADAIDDWDFALQLNRFNEAVAAVREAGLETGLVHCDNTPGTVLHPECHYDMCRVGIGLYGLQPAETTAPRIQLDPVMSVRGRVTRAIYPTWATAWAMASPGASPTQNMQVATVPIGYADGLSRQLSGRVSFLLRGVRVPVVGRIWMDMCSGGCDAGAGGPGGGPGDGAGRRQGRRAQRLRFGRTAGDHRL